jgi:hypothetical protein
MNEWRPREPDRWPNATPAWVMGTQLLALIVAMMIQCYRYDRVCTPLQRFYFSDYVRSQILTRLGIGTGTYELLRIRDAKGMRLAMDADVTTTRAGDGTLVLSQESLKAGAVELVYDSPGRYDNSRINFYLSHWIYYDQSLLDLVRPALVGGLAVLAIALIAAMPKEWERVRLRRYGRQLKGPELMQIAAFNRRTHATGIALATNERPSWMDQILRRDGLRVRIPRELENQHFLLMGDTGMGKSMLIRQILLQVAARNETAIVYDPALEYTPEFYDPERGDRILNPLDDRTPYWNPAGEVRHEAEALTLAASLYPDLPQKDPSLSRAPRALFAHLLTLGPAPEELSSWMCHDEEIGRQVAGMKLALITSQQREAVLSELKAVGRVFRLLPSMQEGRDGWSSREWSRERRGWLFLTSTPQTREWLSPLTSFWLDLLVMRLMNQGMAGARPVWFVLDDLVTLRKLPQLQTAITESRKSNNRFVFGVHGLNRLEESHGKAAKSMLSQTATKVFLRTAEADSANWISETIGEVEIERLHGSRTPGYRWRRLHSKSDQFDLQTKRLVTASEIMALAPRQGYLKSGNLVVRLSFPRIQVPRKAPAFVERTIEHLPKEQRPIAVIPSHQSSKQDQSSPGSRTNATVPPRNQAAPMRRDHFSTERRRARP